GRTPLQRGDARVGVVGQVLPDARICHRALVWMGDIRDSVSSRTVPVPLSPRLRASAQGASRRAASSRVRRQQPARGILALTRAPYLAAFRDPLMPPLPPGYSTPPDMSPKMVQHYAPRLRGGPPLPTYKHPAIPWETPPACVPDFAALIRTVWARLDLTD